MERTRISAQSSAAEIQKILMEFGASRVMQEFKDRKITGLSFILELQGRPIPFSMPIRTDALFKLIQKTRPYNNRERYEDYDRERAERIAWRQLLRWLQAQLAFVQTGQVEAGEVLMAFIKVSGKTMFQQMIESNFLALESPHKPKVVHGDDDESSS